MTKKPNQSLAIYVPQGRIKSLDMLRGLAIILMTMPHQTLLFCLHSSTVGHQLFVIGAFYTRPLFIAVSGMALVLHEQKYRWPFRMIVHGCVLFAMAWCVDVVSHQSLAVDWDIFQLIGACYAIAGVLGYIGDNGKKFLCLLVLWITLAAIPAIRPDEGLFPIWPHSIYFIGGYLIAKYGMSRYNIPVAMVLGLLGSIVYLFSFYLSNDKLTVISATNLPGVAASHACIFLLLSLTLFLEYKKWAQRRLLSILLRFGRYPLSLYFMQQFCVVFGLKFNLRLALTGYNVLDCIIHTTVLLIAMYFTTFLFDRLKILSIEFWLRKIESAIVNSAPHMAVFSPLPTK